MSPKPGAGAVRAARGFSLVEVALVLATLGLLLRATLMPLGTLREARLECAARAQVDAARSALLAHAVVHGALPCPVRPSGTRPTGAEAAVATGRCQTFRGALPATALGLDGPADAAGATLDPWGRALLYAVSDTDADGAGTPGAPDWTSPGEARDVGIDALEGSLPVCRVAARRECPEREVRGRDLAFVVLSHGADASASDLQAGNAPRAGGAGVIGGGDGTFTLAPRSAVEGHRFDDVLAWGSRGEIVLWWLRAGRLP